MNLVLENKDSLCDNNQKELANAKEIIEVELPRKICIFTFLLYSINTQQSTSPLGLATFSTGFKFGLAISERA